MEPKINDCQDPGCMICDHMGKINYNPCREIIDRIDGTYIPFATHYKQRTKMNPIGGEIVLKSRYAEKVRELTKAEALQQFARRKKFALKNKKVNNQELYAGSPLFFYCKDCGIFIEKLPEDHLFPPKTRCSQCEGLEKEGWLKEAKNIAIITAQQVPSDKVFSDSVEIYGEDIRRWLDSDDATTLF